MNSKNTTVGAAMVLGGGIGGMQAALDLAESGIKVYLVDNKSSIGGVMSQLDKTFPTNDCAMCTMAPRLVAIGRHKDIEIISLADIQKIEGAPRNFTVTLNKRKRFVHEDKCTGCGLCTTNCPVRYKIYPVDERPKIILSPEYEPAVSKVVNQYREKKGSLLLILQTINTLYNYFPEEVLRYVSQELNIPLTLILRIATFYNAFSLKPRGKHIINVCMGTACYVRGSERIMERFTDILDVEVEETTEDRLFTLKSVRCIGCCGLAPVATIGNDVHGKLQIKDVPEIINKYKEPLHA